MPVDLKKAIHHNRDENSFTARLFEGILFPSFINDRDGASFNKFINFLNEKGNKNREYILSEKRFQNCGLKKININHNLKFIDGMLFLELYDILSYCKNEDESINFDKKADKTEFDSVILCNDEFHNKCLLVFEVKCYTDLDANELKRQNEWLNELKDKGIINDYYHIALISYDNLINTKSIFKKTEIEELKNGIYIITWDDLYNEGYLNSQRYFDNVDFKLFKNIKYDGDRRNVRKLINL